MTSRLYLVVGATRYKRVVMSRECMTNVLYLVVCSSTLLDMTSRLYLVVGATRYKRVVMSRECMTNVLYLVALTTDYDLPRHDLTWQVVDDATLSPLHQLSWNRDYICTMITASVDWWLTATHSLQHTHCNTLTVSHCICRLVIDCNTLTATHSLQHTHCNTLTVSHCICRLVIASADH